VHSRIAPATPVPPAAVLFDMDGTLVDTEHLWWWAVTEIADRLGYGLTDADLPDVLGRPVAHTAAYLHRTAGTAVPETQIARDLDDAFATRVGADVQPRPGALRLLAELKEAMVPTALVTASPRRVVDLVLGTLGADWFALTVAAEDTVLTKPEPDPYLAAADRLGVAPQACVAVEDSPLGVSSARAAGCHVVAVPSTVTITPQPGVLVVGSLREVDLRVLARFAAARV
jgi:HAD superfamily hydrolase (TIGR01509 family)